jgi:DNA-binding transcriptional MerR regulator
MRMSELSAQSGVPVPTIKYYLREGLLPRGEATSATQASYGEEHVRRLRLIRALVDVGEMSLASVRAILEAVDRPRVGLHHLLGTTQHAVGPHAQAPAEEDDDWRAARETVDDLIAGLDWAVTATAPARTLLAQAVVTMRRLGLPVTQDLLRTYARLAQEMTALDFDLLGGTQGRAELAERLTLGTVLYERAFIAVHRLAQEELSARTYGRGRA